MPDRSIWAVTLHGSRIAPISTLKSLSSILPTAERKLCGFLYQSACDEARKLLVDLMRRQIKKQEVTVSLAAAEEASMDAAVLSHFHSTRTKNGDHMLLLYFPTGFSQSDPISFICIMPHHNRVTSECLSGSKPHSHKPNGPTESKH